MSALPAPIQARFEEGNAFSSDKRWRDAITCYRQVLEVTAQHEWALNNIGYCLWQNGDYEEAIFRLRQAISVGPNNVMALSNLVAVMEKVNLFVETIPYRRRLVELRPDVADYSFSLANMLLSSGRVEEALYYYRQTLRLAPNHTAAHCNYLLALNYSDRETPAQVALEHFRLAHKWPDKRRNPEQFTQSRDPDRVLRIGYLSADFAQHPVGKLIAPLINAHNQTEVAVYGYSDRSEEDPWTSKVRSGCKVFHPIARLTDAELENLILSDQIDLLVELTGYTGGHNRLAVLTAGAAPVQLSFMGYPNTTGVSAIDYRLTDAYSDPPGQTERLYSEKIIRLSRGFLCHTPPAELPPLMPAPFREMGHVTFGVFNNPVKASNSALTAWTQVLHETPGSRLLVKYGSKFVSEALRERWRDLFACAGIEPDRLRFLPAAPTLAGHYQAIGGVDIALDSFPYQGTMTTLETLGMGVPVITLLGEAASSRASSALLLRLGLNELVASDVADYISKAVGLARSPERIVALRPQIRDRFLASEICDVPGFVAELESVYRRLWREWCEKRSTR
jgi:predicted O-linked N-acetylglucosamine transferase (SPINDLY family)